MMNKSGKKIQELNHYGFLSKKLWQFKSREILTDLILCCSDGQIKVHKAVFSKVIQRYGVQLQGEDLECLILPDVAVAEVEPALEMLYLKADAELFTNVFYLQEIKSEVIDIPPDELEPKLEVGYDDNNVEDDHYLEDENHVETNQNYFKTETSVSDSEQDIEKYSYHEQDNEKKVKKGRGRPKGCTDKTKRQTYSFECTECEKDIKGRLAYKKHMKRFHGMAEKKSVEMNVKTQCPYCEKMLANTYIYYSHVATLHRENALKFHPEIEFKKICYDCNKRFYNVCDLGKHTKDVHGKITRKFKCNLCTEEFGDKGILKSHRLMVHKDELIESGLAGFVKNLLCPYCDKKFSLKSQLNGHIYNKHKEKLKCHPEIKPKYSCTPCNESFFGKGDLTDHNALCHGEEYECQFCDMKFKHKPTRSSHVELIHKNETHICEICSKVFKTKSAIQGHMKRHSDGPLYKYPCTHCTRGAQSEEALDKHIETHHQGRQYMCSFCPSIFLNNHERSLHEKRLHAEKNISCNQCDKTFALDHLLNAHVRNVHIKKRDKKCPYCEEEFYDLTTFQCHVNRHNDYRPYSCETCGKSFLTGRDLKKHLSVHTLPHLCDLCEKKFSSKGVLDDHMRKHAGVKLDCRHNCGHSYMDRRGRERHEKSCKNNPQQGATWGAINKQMKDDL